MIEYGKDYPDPFVVPAGSAGSPETPLDLDGAELLDDLRTAITDYVVLPSPEAADAVTLWITATHCLPAFDHATRLVIKSPEKRCGKSRLLEISADTCRKPMVTVNVTEAAIFRSIGDDPPTLLLDEADSMFGTKIKAEQNEGLRGLLNAGYRRGLPTIRTVGPLHTPTEFPTFAMAALAGIGNMPDTIEDRAVIVVMRRRAPGEKVRPYRFRRDRPRLVEIHDRLAVWAASIASNIDGAEPDLPLEDRAADTWEPLVAVADAAGGHWPARARHAAVAMVNASNAEEAERSLNTRPLTDVQQVLDEITSTELFVASSVLVERLHQIEESPWGEFNLTARKLALRLGDYGIKPKPDSTGKFRGYQRGAFTDAFARYLSIDVSDPSEASEGSEHGASALTLAGSLTVRTVRQTETVRPDPRETLTFDASDGSDVSTRSVDDDEPTAPAETGNPRCTVCGKANLYHRDSIKRGICAGCIKSQGETA